jgi:hypothetical protein
MKGDWFKAFGAEHNLEFTKEDYRGWSEMVGQELPFIQKHLPAGSSILECCCGLGCTAIPLSHYYTVTALDKDERVLQYTRINAARFGGDVKIMEGDFRVIDEVFPADSFDACYTGGVLEYYTIHEVRQLVDKQLVVAPLVFISIPIGDGRETTDEYGITRYNYTRQQWLELLEDHNIIDHQVLKAHPKWTGGRDIEELLITVGRKDGG